MLFLTRFSNTSRVFFDTANLTIHCNLRYETMFSVFHVFEIFKKKHKKNVSNRGAKKTSKKDPPGTPFGTQNRWKTISKIPKIAKKPKKSSFLRMPFFDVFFDAFFLKFWKIPTPGIRLNPGLPDLFPPNPLQGTCVLVSNFNRAKARFPSS